VLSQFDPVPTLGDGQVDFEEFVTLLGPKLSTSGIPEKFHGTDFDTVFWKVYPGNWVSARWRCHGACEWLDPRHSEGGREGGKGDHCSLCPVPWRPGLRGDGIAVSLLRNLETFRRDCALTGCWVGAVAG
jgi:hypothetical protein